MNFTPDHGETRQGQWLAPFNNCVYILNSTDGGSSVVASDNYDSVTAALCRGMVGNAVEYFGGDVSHFSRSPDTAVDQDLLREGQAQFVGPVSETPGASTPSPQFPRL